MISSEEHQAQYPGYKYQPKRKSKNGILNHSHSPVRKEPETLTKVHQWRMAAGLTVPNPPVGAYLNQQQITRVRVVPNKVGQADPFDYFDKTINPISSK